MHEGSDMRVSHHFGGQKGMPVAIQTWVIPPGGFEGYHRHDGQASLHEFYQVISGSARMRVGTEVYEMGSGDSVLALSGVEHDLVNTGSGDLRVLVVWGPPGSFDLDRFGSHRCAQQVRSAS